MSVTKSITLEPAFYGEKTIIIAKSGYGKSYTARVIVEEGRKLGNSFVIIDPQDAYLNMPEFSYIDVTKVKSAKTMALVIAASHRNVVIQVKRLSIDDQNKFLKTFLEEFRLHLQRGIQTVVIDEMHKFAPESEKTDSKEIVRGMFQENRSDGLGIIGISQRPQRIDKTCLSQADNLCIGRVTSYRDKEAIKNYIDDPNDLDKIKSLGKGEFYFYGFDNDTPIVEQVRESETEHSGSSPKDLLNEDSMLYQKNIKNFYNGDIKMTDNVSAGSGALGNVLPSKEGFMNLAALGAKMSLGLAAGGLVGTFVGSKFQSPIPVVSSRTLGAAASTVVLYTGYRMLPEGTLKDVAKYATAGSTVFTVGSLLGDLIVVSKVQMPNIVNFALGLATGAAPQNAGKQSESGSEVDLNTAMA
ncbi:MAG: DUF87 domain-containing protein [Candidatus Woesearchaeota archaeon]|jgi:hypothetical protein